MIMFDIWHANCHIIDFDLAFTELNYLICLLCKLRLNASDRVLDTLYCTMESQYKA